MKAFAFEATVMLLAANGAAAQDSSWTNRPAIYGWIAGLVTAQWHRIAVPKSSTVSGFAFNRRPSTEAKA